PVPDVPSIVLTEFKRDLDAYLSDVRPTGGVAGSLDEIIAYNLEHPVEGLKYQQRELLSAQAVDLSHPHTAPTSESGKAAGLAGNKAVIDGILNNGSPDNPDDDIDVIVVPSGHALVNVADRAGYPVLTVPGGYGTGGAGRNPIGVTFVGTAFSEAKLL